MCHRDARIRLLAAACHFVPADHRKLSYWQPSRPTNFDIRQIGAAVPDLVWLKSRSINLAASPVCLYESNATAVHNISHQK